MLTMQRVGGVGGVTVGKPLKMSRARCCSCGCCRSFNGATLALSLRPLAALGENGIVVPDAAAIPSQTLLGTRAWLRLRSGGESELNRKSIGQSALEPDCMLQLACAIELVISAINLC